MSFPKGKGLHKKLTIEIPGFFQKAGDLAPFAPFSASQPDRPYRTTHGS
jgi:hypothetical protein